MKKIVLVVIISIMVAINIKGKIDKEIGAKIDSFNGVNVYFNGLIAVSHGRNLTKDGYNIGVKWQCVEFVKRYYLEIYNHKMPNTYGNAKDFYDKKLKDGEVNTQRDLIQFLNPSVIKPKIGDILLFKPYLLNPYGHVAIISKVTENNIEIIQQNVWKKTRERFVLIYKENKWYIDSKRVIGRLSINTEIEPLLI